MPNMRDVAQRAGVAPMTVSRVINNSGYVSDEVRERVEKAVAELNYVPNRLGPSMRSKRSNTVALIVTDITNPFWTTVLRGVEDAAYKAGYHLFLCNSDEAESKEKDYIELMLSRQVDGFIIAPASTQFKTLPLIQNQGKSVVLIDRCITNCEIDVVRGDSITGARMLTKHLLDLNHQHIVMLNGPKSVSSSIDRARGFRETMLEAGFSNKDVTILWGEYSQDSGYEQALQVIQMRPRPTALVAANNFIAIGAIRALDRSGLHVPDDVSLVVFDALPESVSIRPFLTAATQPAYEMGFLAANRLFDLLDNGTEHEIEEVLLPFELQIRTSSAPPPSE